MRLNFLFLSILFVSMAYAGDSLTDLKKILKNDPDNDVIRIKIVTQLVDKGKIADAIQVMEHGFKYNKDSFILHYELCPMYLKINKPSMAIMHAQESIRLKPDNAGALYNLGLAYGLQGQLDRDAIKAFKQAININPNIPEYYYDLGVAYFNISDYQNSIKCYEKTIELDSNDASAYLNIGTIYNILDKQEKSLIYLRKALDIIGPLTPEGARIIDFIESVRSKDWE